MKTLLAITVALIAATMATGAGLPTRLAHGAGTGTVIVAGTAPGRLWDAAAHTYLQPYRTFGFRVVSTATLTLNWQIECHMGTREAKRAGTVHGRGTVTVWKAPPLAQAESCTAAVTVTQPFNSRKRIVATVLGRRAA